MENIALLTDADKEINLKFDSEIQKLSTTIESMASTIESMASTIEGLKNADNILTNNQKDNALRFHVETKAWGTHWPFDTLITYATKLTDTHNAMNTDTGFFTAPFSGTYGFVFYARFVCENESNRLYVDHNGARSIISVCFTSHISSSVYFALSLEQGDTVGIFTGYARVYTTTTYDHPAEFTGFLLQKN